MRHNAQQGEPLKAVKALLRNLDETKPSTLTISASSA
jgi:hypothetical protein